MLADRGFNIHENAGLHCAEVKLPASTRGKKQLSKADVDTSIGSGMRPCRTGYWGSRAEIQS